MLLSYTSRLVCLTLCSTGILLCILEAIAWTSLPFLLRQSASASARGVERTIFIVGLFVRLAPWLVVLAVWLPAYRHGEDNLAPERVGLFCLFGAACMICLFTLSVCRSLRRVNGTRRYRNACEEIGLNFEGSPMLLIPGEQLISAVTGAFRPRLVVSRAFLEPGLFSAGMLHLAFRHERAHARHRDNLKMLILSFLPHLSVGSASRPSLDGRWRLAAEMAADEEGAMGSQDQSILLAELLVSVAKRSQQLVPGGAFALVAGRDDLQVRVDRLLSERPAAGKKLHEQMQSLTVKLASYTLATGFGILLALCLLSAEFGHSLAEALLHLR